MRHRRKKPVWDPVADWDGMVYWDGKIISPIAAQECCQRTLEFMPMVGRINADDARAKATPIGGMEFFYEGPR